MVSSSTGFISLNPPRWPSCGPPNDLALEVEQVHAANVEAQPEPEPNRELGTAAHRRCRSREASTSSAADLFRAPNDCNGGDLSSLVTSSLNDRLEHASHSRSTRTHLARQAAAPTVRALARKRGHWMHGRKKRKVSGDLNPKRGLSPILAPGIAIRQATSLTTPAG